MPNLNSSVFSLISYKKEEIIS